MAIKLEGTIKRYIGLSTDIKPQSGEPFAGGAVAETIPQGSSFLEADTGRIYRWLGTSWELNIPIDDQLVVLQAVLRELGNINRLLQLATGIEAESLMS